MARYPSLDHLLTLSDDVGVIQHATHDIPNRSTGYCTDDVARALIVAIAAIDHPATADEATRLASIYLSFLHDAQLGEGWFHNFMGYDRCWQDDRGTSDSFGRALWSLGFAMRFAQRDSWRCVSGRLFDTALPNVDGLEHLRSRAYAGLGIAHAIESKPRNEGSLRDKLDRIAWSIAGAYDAKAGPGWTWCEESMTYDNARLCEILIRAGGLLENRRYLGVGLAMLTFLDGVVIENGLFAPVGNQGWFPRGGIKAKYGQQPLEAASMVDAALAARQATGDPRWTRTATMAHDWFFGRNTHDAIMVTGGGCRDGIDENGPNPNMGAESTLAYLACAIAMAERSGRTLEIAR